MRQRRRTLRGASSRLVRLVRCRLDRLLADLALPYLITVAVLRTHLFSPCILYSVTKTGENWSRQPIGLPRSRPFSRRHFWLDSSRFHFQIMKEAHAPKSFPKNFSTSFVAAPTARNLTFESTSRGAIP